VRYAGIKYEDVMMMMMMMMMPAVKRKYRDTEMSFDGKFKIQIGGEVTSRALY
jgi:hypothetical protein